MKGLSHFIMGLAIATCFATAVRATVMEGSLILLLGGIFGVLADTIDFRVAKYMEKQDYEVDPDPENFDPQVVAQTMADAINQAYVEQRTIKIQFHTMKMSADLWRRYSIQIDTYAKEIRCKLGPIVTTGKSEIPGTTPPPEAGTGIARLVPEVIHTYEADTHVDIFSGSDFAFVPEGDKIRIDFIPFHRQWSHSFTFPLLLFPIGFLIYGLNEMGYTASLIILFAYWGHVMLDQTGMLGSNLFPPFTHKRSQGMMLTRAMNSFGNFAVNYTNIMIMVWNVNYFTPGKMIVGSQWAEWLSIGVDSWLFYWVGLANLLILYALIPISFVYLMAKIHTKYYKPERKEDKNIEAKMQQEALASVKESLAE